MATLPGWLLQVFCAVAHDPTRLNRQGADEGTQYRLGTFYASNEQKQVAEADIQQLEEAHALKPKIRRSGRSPDRLRSGREVSLELRDAPS